MSMHVSGFGALAAMSTCALLFSMLTGTGRQLLAFRAKSPRSSTAGACHLLLGALLAAIGSLELMAACARPTPIVWTDVALAGLVTALGIARFVTATQRVPVLSDRSDGAVPDPGHFF